MHSPVLLSADTKGSPLGLHAQQLTTLLWPCSTPDSAASFSVFHRYTLPVRFVVGCQYTVCPSWTIWGVVSSS
jgi:hypothetical protein